MAAAAADGSLYPEELRVTEPIERAASAMGTWWRYGLSKKVLRRLRGVTGLLSAIQEVLEKRFHLSVTPLARTTRNHIMDEVKCFLGFLIFFLGCGEHSVASGEALMDPSALAQYWEYLATPTQLGGRGCARSTMRTKCNHLSHFIVACSVLGFEPVGQGVTYAGIVGWWGRVGKKCGQVRLGAKQAATCRGAGAGGKVEEWEAFVDAVTAKATRVLSAANDLTTPRYAHTSNHCNYRTHYYLHHCTTACLTHCLPASLTATATAIHPGLQSWLRRCRSAACWA
jgi:hypothetical protein